MQKETRWPFNDAILIEEFNPLFKLHEGHVIKNWCYLGTLKYDQGEIKGRISPNFKFDIDTYKIILRFLNSGRNHKKIKQIQLDDFIDKFS